MGIPVTDLWFSWTVRRNRKSFIGAFLILTAILVSVPVVLMLFNASARSGLLLTLLFGIPGVICSYLLIAQRLRDMNLTGWLALLWIPIQLFDIEIRLPLSLMFVIVLCCVPGTTGPNRYGDDPLRLGYDE